MKDTEALNVSSLIVFFHDFHKLIFNLKKVWKINLSVQILLTLSSVNGDILM